MTTQVWELDPDLELYRQEVSERFIISLRDFLEPRGHTKCDVRTLHRVLTWHAAETGLAEMTTSASHLRHVVLLMEYGLEHGKSSRQDDAVGDPHTFLSMNLTGRSVHICQQIKRPHPIAGARGTCSLLWQSAQTSQCASKEISSTMVTFNSQCRPKP